MKKRLLFLATICMLLTAANALANPIKLTEMSGKFDMELDLADGAVIKQELVHDNLSLISIDFEDPNMPLYKVTVAYGEETNGETMSEWPDEELEDLYATIADGFDNPSCEVMELSDGRKAMIINEESVSDYACLVTVYKGYYIQVYVAHEDYKMLTRKEINAAAAMMDQIKILPAGGN